MCVEDRATMVYTGGGKEPEAKDAMHRELVCQPTVMLQDNASLVKAILPRVTNKGRQLRRMCRYINHVKGQINEQVAEIKVVGLSHRHISEPTTRLSISPALVR